LFIDTHVHLYHKRYDSDRDEVIARAKNAGVNKMVMPAIDVPSISSALALAEKWEGLYTMSAIHPSDTKEATDDDFEKVAEFCDHDNVVAVGESGLDYYWDRSFDETQHYFLRKHIELAVSRDLPLILHNRESTEDLIRILKEEKERLDEGHRLRGIFHCFSGSLNDAEEIIDLGFLLGIGGNSTYKNSTVLETIKGVPVDRIVLETDGPFLAPMPYRGKRNEPSYIPHVAERMAAELEMSVEDLARRTSETACSLFGI